MKKQLAILTNFLTLALLGLTANAQAPSSELKHFAREGLSFDYPAAVKFEDASGPLGQTLILTQGEGGAQIMVISRYEFVDSPEQLAKAREEVFDKFVAAMMQEFKKQEAEKVERTEKKIEVGGLEASGVRLHALLGSEPGSAEIYLLVLGRRLVVVSFIGSDKELAEAASAWATVRRSLKVGPRASAAADAPAQMDVPDVGTWTGPTYKNQYFGLTLTIPQGWQVQDASVKQRINEKGKELVTSDDPVKKDQINQAVENTLNLVTVSQYPLGSAATSNPVFVCGAEKVPRTMVKDADYTAGLKQSLQYLQVPIHVAKDIYTQTVGGVEFSVIDLALDFNGTTVNQRYYAHIKKGYALFFIVSYQTEEQFRMQTEMLKTVVLQ